MIHQIGTALSYLHSQNIAHNDLKVDNVLCFHDRQLFKLIDFGYAKRLAESLELKKVNSGAEVEWDESSQSEIEEQYNRWCDRTGHNLAPEVLELQQMGNVEEPLDELSSDVFQFGVLAFFTVLCGIYPYRFESRRSTDPLYRYISQKDYNSFWSDEIVAERLEQVFSGNSELLPPFKLFIQECLAFDPRERTPIDQILKNPLFHAFQ